MRRMNVSHSHYEFFEENWCKHRLPENGQNRSEVQRWNYSSEWLWISPATNPNGECWIPSPQKETLRHSSWLIQEITWQETILGRWPDWACGAFPIKNLENSFKTHTRKWRRILKSYRNLITKSHNVCWEDLIDEAVSSRQDYEHSSNSGSRS